MARSSPRSTLFPYTTLFRSEAERERLAKIVAAEGEFQAAVKLGQAADLISKHPVALQLRTLQTMAEISTEKNSTIIFPRSEEHTSELQSRGHLVCRLLLEKK